MEIDGSLYGNCVAYATVFPSNTIISMRLSDPASIFTNASKYIVFTDSFMSPGFMIFET